MWQLTAVIERYRMASNGELVFELYDMPSGTYMNAYMPNPACLSSTTRGRAQILAARNAFTSACPARDGDLADARRDRDAPGRRVLEPGEGRRSARSANGAELRPVTNFVLMQGCGKF